MSSEDTHLIPSDRAVWSLMMLINGQTPSCCFVARLQSHMFVIFNSLHMQSATRQVGLDSFTYFQLLFPAPSVASLKFNQSIRNMSCKFKRCVVFFKCLISILLLLKFGIFYDKQEIINETTFGCHLDAIFKTAR